MKILFKWEGVWYHRRVPLWFVGHDAKKKEGYRSSIRCECIVSCLRHRFVLTVYSFFFFYACAFALGKKNEDSFQMRREGGGVGNRSSVAICGFVAKNKKERQIVPVVRCVYSVLFTTTDLYWNCENFEEVLKTKWSRQQQTCTWHNIMLRLQRSENTRRVFFIYVVAFCLFFRLN